MTPSVVLLFYISAKGFLKGTLENGFSGLVVAIGVRRTRIINRNLGEAQRRSSEAQTPGRIQNVDPPRPWGSVVYTLDHRSMRLHHWGFYFLGPPEGSVVAQAALRQGSAFPKLVGSELQN